MATEVAAVAAVDPMVAPQVEEEVEEDTVVIPDTGAVPSAAWAADTAAAAVAAVVTK